MQLLPITPDSATDERFLENDESRQYLLPSIAYYDYIGFAPPWIGYYAEQDGQLVGTAAFKGAPRNGQVEIAYATFPSRQHQGIGTAMCKALVDLATATDPTIRIMARTLPEANFSTRILEKNGFVHLGAVEDEEDGWVWEWEYQG